MWRHREPQVWSNGGDTDRAPKITLSAAMGAWSSDAPEQQSYTTACCASPDVGGLVGTEEYDVELATRHQVDPRARPA